MTETIRAAGLGQGLTEALARRRKPSAVHGPGKLICGLALSLALGGEPLSDLAVLRTEPGAYGPVASDPTVSRLMGLLAEEADRRSKAIAGARHQAHGMVWGLAGKHAPDHRASAGNPVVIYLDASLITAHPEKVGSIGGWNGAASLDLLHGEYIRHVADRFRWHDSQTSTLLLAALPLGPG